MIRGAFISGNKSQLAFWDQELLTDLAQSATLLQVCGPTLFAWA